MPTSVTPARKPHAAPRPKVRARCLESLDAAAHQAALRERDLTFGPSLHGVRNIRRRDGEAIGELRIEYRLARPCRGALVIVSDAGHELLELTARRSHRIDLLNEMCAIDDRSRRKAAHERARDNGRPEHLDAQVD